MSRLAALLIALSLLGCAQPPKPKPQYTERITLLPNHDGRPSAVVVTRAGAAYELATPYATVQWIGDKAQRTENQADEVQQRLGELLESQPARPFTFVLYFNTRTTELTPQSRAALNDVREKIKSFPAAQVVVIGHADGVGSVESNDALSLRRASALRDTVVQIGIPRQAIEVVGRGEREPLVQTADGVASDRNRRVEVKLR